MAPNKLLTIEIPRNRVFGLDVLRAAAILFVVYSHGAYVLAQLLPKSLVLLPTLDGVSIFFVLSGFLIGGIIIRQFESQTNRFVLVREFWVRRWFRTLPNYFFMLAILVACQALLQGEPIDQLWKYLFFLQNFSSKHPPFFPEAWSLSVEEWFYLLLPLSLLLLVMLRVPFRHALLLLVTLTIVGSVALRYGRFLDMDAARSSPLGLNAWDGYFRKQVITRLDSLAYGVLGAWLYHYYPALWRKIRWPALLLGISLLLAHKLASYFLLEALPRHQVFYTVFYFSLISLGTLLLLPCLSLWRRESGFWYGALTKISLISYSMYLVHFSLVRGLLVPETLELLPLDPGSLYYISYYLLYWGYTLVLSILIYKYFELPVMKLRERVSSKE